MVPPQVLIIAILMVVAVGLWANLVILAALGAVDPGSNPGRPTPCFIPLKLELKSLYCLFLNLLFDGIR